MQQSLKSLSLRHGFSRGRVVVAVAGTWCNRGKPSLLGLRRAEDALRSGRLADVAVTFSEDARWLRMTRGAMTVLASFAEAPQSLPIDGEVVLGWPPQLANESAPPPREARSLSLPPLGVVVTRTA